VHERSEMHHSISRRSRNACPQDKVQCASLLHPTLYYTVSR
jgi:hypothetical protein